MDDGSKSNFDFPGDKKTYMFEKKYTKIQVATNASFAPGGSFEGFRLYDEHGQMFFEIGNLNFQIKDFDLGKNDKIVGFSSTTYNDKPGWHSGLFFRIQIQ